MKRSIAGVTDNESENFQHSFSAAVKGAVDEFDLLQATADKLFKITENPF
jgi:hypothetical protein